jgi:zinc transport system substrate-binding protein
MKLLVLLILLVGCSPPPAVTEQATGSLRVIASTYPLQVFAERIGGQHVQASCPVPSGADPAIWQPDTTRIQTIQQADLIILNGAGFEAWPEKVSLPNLRVVDTSAPLKPTLIHYENTTLHSHGPEGEHAHEGLDGHTWLDPQNAKVQAKEILAALSRSRPEEAATFSANFDNLAEELNALDVAFRALQLPPLLAAHPAYNYLARRYAWNIRSLDLDPENMPPPAAIAEIQVILKSQPAAHLLWESAPRAEIAAKLQELGLQSLVFAPGESQPEAGDYLHVMHENLGRLQDLDR